MTLEPIPVRYQYSVVPHIMIKGASAAIEWYKQAFGATELFRISQPDGQIMHAEISISDSMIMLSDTQPPFHDPLSLGGETVGLHVFVPDADTLFDRAVDAGATAVMPVRAMFYGARMGMLEDPFGHMWALLTYEEDVPPEEIVRRGEAMLGQGDA